MERILEGMQEFDVKGEKFYIQKKVGSGYTSEVFKAVNSRGETLCVKVINTHFYSNHLGQELVNNEIAILGRLDHANILKFYKKEAKDKLMIVTEYCPDGNLYDYLCKKRTLPEEQVLQVMRGVVRGCNYMMDKGILHRDLKPQNIFLKGKNIKIADFGFAVDISNTKLMGMNVGSPLYMPYQSLHQKKFSIKSDIFAIGVIWYELISGKTPFEASSQAELKEKVKNGVFRSKDLKCNKKTQELIFKCLSFRMDSRPTIKQLSTAIQEMAMPQKEKSKTVYDDLIFKKADKENLCNKTVIIKQANRVKTSQTKKTETAVATRVERCKTFIANKQVKDPFKEYIQSSLSRKSSRQVTDRTNKKVNSDQVDERKSTQSFLEYLKRLQKLSLPFLPLSIQAKFSSLLVSYQNLLSQVKILPQESKELQKDDMLSVLATCTKQSQFCKCCLGFVRRLMRLAKSYKEWSSCLKQLGALWQRVERESNRK